MASFFSLLDQITTEPGQARDGAAATPHHNPHATPTPVDSAALYRMLQDQLLTLRGTALATGSGRGQAMLGHEGEHAYVLRHNPHATPTPVDTAALFRLLQDQLQTLHVTAPTEGNREFLESLISSLEDDIHDPPTRLRGVSQEFVDSLDRVNRKTLDKDDDCAICKVPYLEDEYCLVVELPCDGRHQFDLECVGPWLRSKGTCPMCRQEMGKRKVEIPQDDEEEEEDPNMLYA